MIEISNSMRRADAARYIRETYGIPGGYDLAKYACIGGGPAFRKAANSRSTRAMISMRGQRTSQQARPLNQRARQSWTLGYAWAVEARHDVRQTALAPTWREHATAMACERAAARNRVCVHVRAMVDRQNIYGTPLGLLRCDGRALCRTEDQAFRWHAIPRSRSLRRHSDPFACACRTSRFSTERNSFPLPGWMTCQNYRIRMP